jgi:hypothetical protein
MPLPLPVFFSLSKKRHFDETPFRPKLLTLYVSSAAEKSASLPRILTSHQTRILTSHQTNYGNSP